MIRKSIKTVVGKNYGKRTFWNLCNGKSIGFIESVYKAGVFIQTEFASFRETSSNLSNGDVRELSISYLSKEDRELLDKVLDKKIPVMIHFSKDMFGSPFKGDLLESRYIHSIKILNDETLNVKL
jgi:hypothetical protein